MLQHQSPAMGDEVVARTVEGDLGAPPNRLFAAWEDAPIAAASIGQVHRARLRDGTLVAVKVRYPAIDRVIRDALRNADLLRHAACGVACVLRPEQTLARR